MKQIKRLSDLVPDDKNANKGTERGGDLLERSLQNYGAGRSILIDKAGRIIAGNKTAEKAVTIGLDDEVIVVKTDGKKLVVVQRTDLDLTKDKAARELAVLDNRVGQLDLDWNAEELLKLKSLDIDLTSLGFSDKELGIFDATSVAEVQQEEALAYRIVVECKSERHQAQLLKKFEKEGIACQALIS